MINLNLGDCMEAMKIENIELTEEHVWRTVIYIPQHASGDRNSSFCETGIIKSWNERFVFVNYNGNVQATETRWLKWF